jgi:phosphoribosylaminoimidazole-succinocarboxamide synthase
MPDGTVALQFKDDVTGENGVIDPGANSVGGQIAGKSAVGIRFASYFFELLESKGYPTHFIESDIGQKIMLVKPVTMFGNGLECICRFIADGSGVRRFGMYAKKGDVFKTPVVETTLKDDARGDPACNASWASALGLCGKAEFEAAERLTQEIAQIVAGELKKRGLILWDIKFEFARDAKTGEVILIDEISTDCWRVRDVNGESVSMEDLTKRFFEMQAV